MVLMMEVFNRRFRPAVRLASLHWRFWARAGVTYIDLRFEPKSREFEGHLTLDRGRSLQTRPLTARDIEKIRRCLPPEAIAECTRVSLGAA